MKRYFALLFILLIGTAVTGWAQAVDTFSITISAVSLDGVALPGATISIREGDNQSILLPEITPGRYQGEGIPRGYYVLEASAGGFKTVRRPIPLSAPVNLLLALEVSTIEDTPPSDLLFGTIRFPVGTPGAKWVKLVSIFGDYTLQSPIQQDGSFSFPLQWTQHQTFIMWILSGTSLCDVRPVDVKASRVKVDIVIERCGER